MRLTFEKGQFRIDELPASLARDMRDRWTPGPDGGYTTSDLRAAAQFRTQAVKQAKVLLSNLILRVYDSPTLPLPESKLLDAHQKKGVEWILTRSRSYLAHAPGAGKTIQAIVAANAVGGDVLFIVPPLLVENWKQEIRAWGHAHVQLEIVPNVKSTSWEFPTWIICPDSLITRPDVIEFLRTRHFSMLFADEASRFKELSAARTRAAFSLVPGTRHAVLLDGSPMPNRPRELWAPVYSLAPEVIDFMDEQEFGFRYCGATMNIRGQWEFKGAARVEELRGKLTRAFMHVVREEDLSHPERRRRILWTEPSKRAHHWNAKTLAKLDLSTLDDNCRGEIAEVRQEIGISKIDWAAEYVAGKLNDGERVLLFFWHREVGRRLAQILGRPLIDGSVPMEKRNEIFRDYQAGKPLSDCIIGNVIAMGRGVNLQETDRIVFAEFSWSDETNKQAEKRASRRGSRRAHVPCDYIATPGTLDDVVLRTVFKKQTLFDRMIRSNIKG